MNLRKELEELRPEDKAFFYEFLSADKDKRDFILKMMNLIETKSSLEALILIDRMSILKELLIFRDIDTKLLRLYLDKSLKVRNKIFKLFLKNDHLSSREWILFLDHLIKTK
jgi:hypothetical protein